MGQASVHENPEELLLHLVSTLSGGQAHQDEVQSLIGQIKTKQRQEIADDVNRSNRPDFVANEAPDLVARAVRSIDLRLITDGSEAPYYVAPGEEDPDRFSRRQVIKGAEYFRTHTGLFHVLVEQVLDEKPSDWSMARNDGLPGVSDSLEAHTKAVEEFVGRKVQWTGEKTSNGFTFVVAR